MNHADSLKESFAVSKPKIGFESIYGINGERVIEYCQMRSGAHYIIGQWEIEKLTKNSPFNQHDGFMKVKNWLEVNHPELLL